MLCMTPSRAAAAIFTALALASAIGASAQSIKSFDGRWEGVMEREGAAMTVRFDFHTVAGTLTGRFTSETQRAMEYPLDKVVYSDPTIHWELGGLLVFDGVVSPQ